MNALPELPHGWVWKTVSELAAEEPNAITDGPFGSNLKTAHYTESGPRVIRLQNIGDGVFNDALAHISIEHYERLSKHSVKAGDIVIAALGEVLPRACLIPESVGPAIVKADCVRFRPHPTHNAKYLNCALNLEATRRLVKPIVHGVGRPRLNVKEIKSIPLPVAPRKQQDRIVEEIEEQLTRLDAGVTALKRVQANLKRYRAAVLKGACEGRLVPTEAALAREEGRPYEPASVLLARIAAEKATTSAALRRGNRRRDGRAPSPVDIPPLPEGWAWAIVGDLAEVTSGNTPNGITRAVALHGDLPWFKVGAMNLPGNERELQVSNEWLTRGAAQSLGMRTIPAGAIVFPKRGGAIATNKKRRMRMDGCCDLNLMALVPAQVVRDYLWWWLAGVDLGKLSDGSNVPQINHKDIAPLLVPVAPEQEQHRIVAEVERRLSLADELDRIVSANLHRVTRLRQSVLQGAFRCH